MAEDLPSKTQLDKLGDRLRAGSKDEADLRALNDYRLSFRPAYESVMGSLEILSRLEKTGRPAKTTNAIVDKLNRQKIRLTQIQDIAGIRLVCDDSPSQDIIVLLLSKSLFPTASVDDRRIHPSHGYRAVHLIVRADPGRLVEIQVRTRAQHRWAEVSEKLADLLDPAIKYGGGPELATNSLASYSETVRHCEELERQHDDMLYYADKLRSRTSDALTSEEHDKLKRDADDLASRVREQRAMLERSLEEIAKYVLKSVRDSRRDNTR